MNLSGGGELQYLMHVGWAYAATGHDNQPFMSQVDQAPQHVGALQGCGRLARAEQSLAPQLYHLFQCH